MSGEGLSNEARFSKADGRGGMEAATEVGLELEGRLVGFSLGLLGAGGVEVDCLDWPDDTDASLGDEDEDARKSSPSIFSGINAGTVLLEGLSHGELSNTPCLFALCVFRKYLLQNSLSHSSQNAS